MIHRRRDDQAITAAVTGLVLFAAGGLLVLAGVAVLKLAGVG